MNLTQNLETNNNLNTNLNINSLNKYGNNIGTWGLDTEGNFESQSQTSNKRQI